MCKIKVIKEHKDFYEADIDGKKTKLYKIDTKKIEQDRYKSLDKIASILNTKEVIELLRLLHSYSRDIPNINMYLDVALNITKKIDKLYDKVAPYKMNFSNIFHSYCKQIDPEIYGKAQTLMQEINYLIIDLQYIRKKMGDD